MENFFKGCVKPEHVKALYRELAMKHHPDRGGDLETMKQVNAQYHAKLKSFDGATSYSSETKREHTYKYDFDVEEALLVKIAELLALRMEGVTIAAIGTWVWIIGETRPHKDRIKALGCRWSNERTAWYWHSGQWKGRRSKSSLAGLAVQYGYKGFEAERKEKISA